MQWRYFEGLAAALWTKQGYSFCYCTPQSGDLGVDVVAISGGKGVLIQTKTSGQDGAKLGWETVKDVSTGAAHYQKQHPHVNFRKVGLTNQFFNPSAHQQAQLNGVELIDQNGLAQLLEQYPVKMLEIEQILFSEWER